MNRGLARKDQGFIDTLSQDPDIVDALLQATRYDFVYEHEFIPVELLGALDQLSQIASLEEATIAALTSVVMERERFSNSFLIAAELLEDRVDCMSLNICSDTLKRELHTQLFPNTYRFDNGTIVFETPLGPEVVQSLYRAGKEVEAQFYRLLETNEPVRDDKEVLHVKIYGSKSEYWQFQAYLFGVDDRTAAGIYSSDNIAVYTYYAQDSPNLEEVFRHEYVHYLDDVFISTALGNDCLLTWFHEGLAEFLMGSTQAMGISVLRLQIDNTILQEAGGTQRLNPAQIFDLCYSGIGFNDDLYNYSSLFFHFMYQQRRSQLLELIDLVRSDDTSSSLDLIDTWAKDTQLAADYSAFVDEQVANVDQLPYHPDYSIFLPDDFDSQINPPRDTVLILPDSLQSDNSTEIENALQQINGDLGLDCRTVITEPNPRFECTGYLPSGSEFSGDQDEPSSEDQGESDLFSLFDAFTGQGTQSSRDRGPLNEHLNAQLDSFIVAAVEDGKINNFEDMTCYFTNVAGSPPVADLYCEGPLRPTPANPSQPIVEIPGDEQEGSTSQLQQNAPNPFNNQTVLSYFLHAPGPVRVEVFSLTGQRVAVLHQGPQQVGYHRLHWDGRDNAGRPVASGMYLYRLVTDEAVLTRKLMLLR